MYSDDDANSDASSVCSERSYGSRNGGIPHYLRQTEDVAEVLNHCASSNWSERKEGLLGLQNLLKSQRTLSRVELKRLCEIFTRMFADPHSKPGLRWNSQQRVSSNPFSFIFFNTFVSSNMTSPFLIETLEEIMNYICEIFGFHLCVGFQYVFGDSCGFYNNS